MALLDIFQIVFESNAKEAEKGLKGVGKEANNTEKDLNNATSASKKLKDAAKSLGVTLGTLAAGYLTVAGVMDRVENINTISQTAEAIGDSVENVDAFGKALTELGGDAQGARDTLTDLAESMGEALKDTESGRAKSFKELGVSLKDANGNAKNTTQTLLELAGAVEGMSKQEAVFKIKELGITDNRSVEAVLKGRKELERLLRIQKENGVVSKESAQASKLFTESLNKLKGAAANSTAGFLDSFIPVITKVLQWLGTVVDWAQENKDFVTGFFIAVGSVVATVYVPAMIKAAMATLAATWPILAIGAAVAVAAAAFALIYDDIMNFIEGNESLIGQIFEKYPLIQELVFGVIDAFKALGGVIVDTIVGAWNTVKGIFDLMSAAISGIGSALGAVGGVIKMAVTGSAGSSNSGAGSVSAGVASGQQALVSASANPMNSTTSNSISNQSNSRSESNVTVGSVTVQTQATDAKGIAAAIPNELPKQIKNLRSETATGVAR